MVGPDERDPQSLPATGDDFARAAEGGIRGLRIGWSPDLGVELARRLRVPPELVPIHNPAEMIEAFRGGNIDVTFLSRIIERGLVKDGRLVRLRLHVPDHPGALNRLTGLVAAQRANVIEIAHDRAYFGVSLGDTVLDITLETRGNDHIGELLAALTGEGYTFERVT